MIKIAPSILAADFARLGEEIKTVADAGAEYLHIDIMDGVFVPNISFGPHVIRSIRPISDLFFDVHLMIHEPLRFIEPIAQSGADCITFHIESTQDPLAVINKIRACGKKVGIAIKPGTDITSISPFIPSCDMILLMTVMPGFGNQKLMPEVLPTIATVRSMGASLGVTPDIEVDGGINIENAALAAKHGANILVAGSAVFRSNNPVETIRTIRQNAACAYSQNLTH